MAHNELVQSLLRAVDVLELIGQAERGMTLAEVCSALDMKSSTVHNILRTLSARDYLERTTSPVRFRLGSAVFRLGDELHNHQVVRHASTIVRDLFERLKPLLPEKVTGSAEASISFAQHWGGEVVMLTRLRLQRPGVLERPRMAMGAYSTASALCYQACWAPEELDSFRTRHPFLDQGAPLWKTQERLDDFLEKVRELGYAKPPIFKPDSFRCAVPVWGQGHRLLGVLGAGVWLQKPFAEGRQLIKDMIESSHKIGESF